MTTTVALLVAAVLVPVTLYAQVNVARFTSARSNAIATRVLLLAVGAGLGYVATRYAETPLMALLYFAIGIGIAHVPAAFILFLKGASGAGRS